MTEHNLELLSLTGGCKGSSESTHVKMPHCRKSHVAAHISYFKIVLKILRGNGIMMDGITELRIHRMTDNPNPI